MDNQTNEIMNYAMSYSARIQHILMLKSKFIPDVGLLDGKMGIAIAFAHLYGHTHNDIYYDYMSELLDDVVENIYKGLDIGFMFGFSGIGWGIEYLLQNQFVEGESLEICEEIDKKITAFDPRRIIDTSLENGLEGLLHYILIHIFGNKKEENPLPFDEMYLSDLYKRTKCLISHNNTVSLTQLGNIYIDWYEKRSILNYQLNIIQFICSPVIDQKLLSNSQLGIRNGLSGILLKQLTI